ncbi:MAG: glutamate--cysteine ligase [Gammaproteobacteria bacterium]|nr:glutamate--cysteine ligase [Gammaproteobacteria bacterium]
MYSLFEQRLTQLIRSGRQGLLKGSKTGLERETLRVAPDGGISQTPHPEALGSALAHPYITTDYSEALLEFITPPLTDLHDALRFLRNTHQFVYANLGEELLWAGSMPCVIAGEAGIPIAQYGKSNPGMMKTVYRRGLGHRYGRMMQAIAGVHFNYSLSEAFWPVYQELEKNDKPLQDFAAEAYFGLIRNLQRFGWLIDYLFGASPAICKSFLNGQPGALSEFDPHTYYEPWATSLRMSNIGYQNNREGKIGIKARYSSLDAYIGSLTRATTTICPQYEKTGIVVNGEYRQLNACILQIENEYYSTVRPKQIPKLNEKPSLALKKRGIRYIELRSLDVNTFEPLGISLEQLRFLEIFMIFCLFLESPPVSDKERQEIDNNQINTARRGRDPALYLQHNGTPRKLAEWSLELCEAMQACCDILDEGAANGPYTRVLQAQMEVIRDADRTPSARILAEMRETGEGFHDFTRRLSWDHRKFFQTLPIDREQFQFFKETGRNSVRRQKDLEAADDVPFEEYLRRYFAQR